MSGTCQSFARRTWLEVSRELRKRHGWTIRRSRVQQIHDKAIEKLGMALDRQTWQERRRKHA